MCYLNKVACGVIFGCLSLLNLIQCLSVRENIQAANYSFPDDFIFGVSTSSYQIEGGWNEGGKGENIWDTYLHQNPNFTIDGSNGDVAADSYHKYMEDIQLIKELGVSSYRLSLSWTRILPNGTDHNVNKEGVLHYRRFFKELIKADIVPIVTLHHWEIPTEFIYLGGWSNRMMVDYFEDYAKVAFQVFGDLVKNWLTINEIRQYCTGAYVGEFFQLLPALTSPGLGVYLCMHHMLLAHARAYRLYDKEFRSYQKGKIGISLDGNWATAKHPDLPEDEQAAEHHRQMHVGIIAHPILSGDYPESVRRSIYEKSKEQGYSRSRLPRFTSEEMEDLRGSADFLGVNHYTTAVVSPPNGEEQWKVPSFDHDVGVKYEQNPSWSTPGVWWLSIYPPGLRNILKWLTKTYGRDIPLIVIENGFGDDGRLEDYDRVSYINDYLYQLLLAIHEDGCNVQGYFAWSLLDSFEWSYGLTVKFGLYHVDFNSPNRTRTPKLSAETYSNIVRTRQVDFDPLKNEQN